ncbi:MAG: hypothetical protein QHH30_06285 [candidate division NC10 bacterium]|nr:hypothetical protein [candidate division NC10 bacterium]
MKVSPPFLTLIVLALMLWGVQPALAAVKVELGLSRGAINFPDADPDTTPSIPAAENPVLVTVKVSGNAGGDWRLTALASGDLVFGSHTIPISNVSWTAQPLPFIDGKLDKATPQVMASGTGNANSTGSLRLFFKNSWSYSTGNYSQVIIFTLSAP